MDCRGKPVFMQPGPTVNTFAPGCASVHLRYVLYACSMHVLNEGVFFCTCVFACEVSPSVGGRRGCNNTRLHIRWTLTHRWGKGTTGSGGKATSCRKSKGRRRREDRWQRAAGGEASRRSHRGRHGGIGAVSGSVPFSWFSFCKVTKK